MSIIIEKISYIHPDRETLFQDISFSVEKGSKVSLIGNNGVGKSTFLKMIAGVAKPSAGNILVNGHFFYVPQHFGQYDKMNVAEALGVDSKLKALKAILKGDASEENFTVLNEDWNIEEKVFSAFRQWNIPHIQLFRKMDTISGGEKTKVFLSGILIHEPDIILMDEPSNHLDLQSREKLYNIVENTKATILVVSHDRALLNLVELTYELYKDKVEIYGGNYEFYKEQKENKLNALHAKLEEKEKSLRAARKLERETIERKQKMDARGKKKSIRSGTPRIMMNTLRNSAEKSTSRLKDVHEDKISQISEEMTGIRKKLPDNRWVKMDFGNANLHIGKILALGKDINFTYGKDLLWKDGLNFEIRSGDRIVLKGDNGSGKTTLLKIIFGELQPNQGDISLAEFDYVYIDQDYSVVNDSLTLLDQVQQFNILKLPEHEIKTILHRFLFPLETWNKPCNKLSGGEKMRLVFCCMMIQNQFPDMFVLDEPTNNLDIQTLEIITAVIKNYKGTVIVISHDRYFIEEIGADKKIEL